MGWKLYQSVVFFMCCIILFYYKLHKISFKSVDRKRVDTGIIPRLPENRNVPLSSVTTRAYGLEMTKAQPELRNTKMSNLITSWVLLKMPAKIRSPYLTVFTSRGRLGNQLFQMASLVGIALKYDYIPLLPEVHSDITDVINLTRFERATVDISKHKQFQEGDLSRPDRDITKFINLDEFREHINRSLDGYFQSYKHFSHAEQVIRQLITFNEDIIQETRHFLKNNVNPNTITVGIHVRRGDFLNDYHASLGRVTVNSEFIKKAMDIYTSQYSNVTFIVFSNDMAWCKEHVHADRIIFSPFQHPGHDLAVMSQCDHMIISVGTFGWWGGWLSGGSVVYFNGYPRPGSEIDIYFNKTDFYPSHWIPLS